MFPGTTVPPRLQVSAEEMEQRRIAAMASNPEREAESLSCLSGILKDTEKAMATAASNMNAENTAAAAKLAEEIAEREATGGKIAMPGRRANRNRRRKSQAPAREGAK